MPGALPPANTSGIDSSTITFFCGRAGRCCAMKSGAITFNGSSTVVSAFSWLTNGFGFSHPATSFHVKLNLPTFNPASTRLNGIATEESPRLALAISSEILAGHASEIVASGTVKTSLTAAASLFRKYWV